MLEYNKINNVISRLETHYRDRSANILLVATTAETLSPVVDIPEDLLHKIFRELDNSQIAEMLMPFLKEREAEIYAHRQAVDMTLAKITGTDVQADYDVMSDLFVVLSGASNVYWEFEVEKVAIACKVTLLRDTMLVYEGYTFEPTFKSDLTTLFGE